MNKKFQLAKEFLIQNKNVLGSCYQKSPEIWDFEANKLPHNDVLNDTFFAACTSNLITIYQESGGNWVLIL